MGFELSMGRTGIKRNAFTPSSKQSKGKSRQKTKALRNFANVEFKMSVPMSPLFPVITYLLVVCFSQSMDDAEFCFVLSNILLRQ